MSPGWHHRGMAASEAQYDSPWPGFGQRAAAGRHGRRITGLDVGDAAGDHQARSRAQVNRGLRKCLSSHRFPVPQGSVPELLDLSRHVTLHRGRLVGERAGKNAQPAWVDALQPSQAHVTYIRTRETLFRFGERLEVLDIGLLQVREKRHVVRAIDEPYRQHDIVLEEAFGLDDDADQLPVVEQDILDASQPATGRAQHHVFVMVDLDLVRRLVGDLLRVRGQPETAAEEVDLFETSLPGTERAESVAQVWRLPADIVD